MTTQADLAVQAALLAIKNKAAIHYTQNSPARWSGIHNGLIAANGQFPKYADCSSFTTWCLWQALRHGADIVNGTGWKSGFTGTQSQHGKAVSLAQASAGDLVFYGHPIYHVAMIIGKQNGVPVVASHGEESGPYVVKYNQWGVNSIRRYLTTEAVPKPAAPHPSANPMHGHSVPGVIASGTGDYFGLISGPNQSHGGAFTAEQPYVKLIQEFLNWKIKAGLVVDGKFGATTYKAVSAYQHQFLPKTTNFGQVWFDDWTSMAKW